jgi:homoserine kinase
MASIEQLKIRVPATSANLGPGFDLMGMALNIYNEFRFYFQGVEKHALELTNGDPIPFPIEDDLTWKSYIHYFSKFLPDNNPIPYRCKMKLGLPLKGGLGSSASAVVAGFNLAKIVHSVYFPQIPTPTQVNFLNEIAMFEGHPDNTLPAQLGGWVFSFWTKDDKLHILQKKFPKSIKLKVITPSIQISTDESRKTLPKDYPIADVLYNIARTATWIEFLDNRKYSDLQIAVHDKIHTPYRITEGSILHSISKICNNLGIAYCLSGSGPSILCFFPRKHQESLNLKLNESIEQVSNDWKTPIYTKDVLPDNKGVQIELRRNQN